MSNESEYREFVNQVINIERVLYRGEDGLVELRELWQWCRGTQFDAQKVVDAFSPSTQAVLLQGFIENFCE